jgi:hypothetical protein
MDLFELPKPIPTGKKADKSSGCAGFKSYGPDFTWDYDCGYNTTIDCDECKYAGGRKDPEAKCNQEKN